MNTKWFKGSLIFASTLLLMLEVGAQAKPKPKPGATRKSTSRPTSGYSSAYTTGNAAKQDTTKKKPTGPPASGYSSGYGNNSATPSKGSQPLANVPIVMATGGKSGIGDSVSPSLRTDNAIDRNLVKDRTPLAYEHIREDDAVYKQRVWREIDTREKMNLPFRYAANEDNGNQRFISILFDAIQSGNVTAFSGDDDRFTIPLTKEQVAQSLTGGLDTIPVTDLDGNTIRYDVRQKQVEPDSIYRYRLKEEWIFDKESSRMFVRILGIAPIMMKYTSNGIPIADQTLFWAYYPDLRPTLAKYEVYNGKNYAGRMSWEELFESRFFSSFVTKSTLDNPFDRSLKEFVKDPLFRLLEGENIKDKIFNYEQDLWSY